MSSLAVFDANLELRLVPLIRISRLSCGEKKLSIKALSPSLLEITYIVSIFASVPQLKTVMPVSPRILGILSHIYCMAKIMLS
jgi:hypothetical protein